MAIMTEETRRRMDAIAHAMVGESTSPSAETAPAAQRGVASGAASTGDKLMSADVRAPSSLRPASGTGSRVRAEPTMYREIKEAEPSGGMTAHQSYLSSYGSGATSPWTGTMPEITPFEFRDAPTYEGSKYDNWRDELLAKLDREKFEFDPATDPSWQAYQKQYRREGQRATEDVLGRAAAATGGVPSSYAVTAAAQAGNNYAAQLSDKIPQIYNDAYNRYLAQYEKQLGLADRYNQYGEQDYNKYRDTLAQYNTDRNFAYGTYADDYNRRMNQYNTRYQEYLDEQDRIAAERSWEYGVEQDALNRAEKAAETEYQHGLDAEDRARQDRLDEYNQQQDAMNWWWTIRQEEYNRGQNETAQQQALREYEDQQLQQQINNAYKFISTFGYVPDWAAELLGVPAGTSAAAVGIGGSGGGGGGGVPQTSAPTAPSGTEPGSGQTAPEPTVTGAKHRDGSPMTQGFTQVWTNVRNRFDAGASEEEILRTILSALEAGRIADYEIDIILDQLGMSGGTGGKASGGGGKMVQMTR